MGNRQTKIGAISFNGTTVGTIPHHASLLLGSDFCIEFMIEDGCSDGTVLSQRSGSSGWKVTVESSQLHFYFGGVHETLSIPNDYNRYKLDVVGGTYSIKLNEEVAREGSVSGNLHTATDLIIGQDWTGILGEIRLSNKNRSKDTFLPRTQLEDDKHTVLLLHFNEGQPSLGTAYDTSEYRNHVTFVGTSSYVDSYYLPNPITIVRDVTWLALDSSIELTEWLSAFKGYKKYRYRPNDDHPQKYTIDNTPALTVIPLSLPVIVPETVSNSRITIPISIEGHMHSGSVSQIESFWWLVTDAIFQMYDDRSTAGRFNYNHIQHMIPQGPSFDVAPKDQGLFASFADVLNFQVSYPFLRK